MTPARASAILVLLGSHALAGGLAAQGAGSAASTLLRLDPAPRTLALGGAGVALEGPWATAFNPAAAAGSAAHLALAYRALPVGASTGGATYGRSAGSGEVAATLRFVDYGEVEVLEPVDGGPVGRPTGATATGGEVSLGLGYALPLGPVTVGLGARWLRMDVAGLRDDALAADVGVTARPVAGLVVGASAQNMGGEVSAGRDAPLPTTLRIGVAGSRPLGERLNCLAALEARRREERLGAGGGVELELDFGGFDAAIRVGYETRPDAGDAFAPLAVGGGVRVDRLAVDLAYRGLGPLGTTRMVGLSWRF